MNTKNSNIGGKSISKYVRMSPTKVRRILDQIKGKTYKEALIILDFMPHRAVRPIIKTLCSSVANVHHNIGLPVDNLIVGEAFVNNGPTLKRFRPRAQGRAFKILKPTCHITIVVKPKDTKETLT